MTSKLIAMLAAGIVVAATASVAFAAADATPVTGTWSGKTSQDLSLTEEEWSVKITVTTLNGRLAGIYTTARMECPDPAVQDVRVLHSFAGKGPKLRNGVGFDVRVDGVHIRGVLGKAAASGRFDVSRGGCSGKGTWKAKRIL